MEAKKEVKYQYKSIRKQVDNKTSWKGIWLIVSVIFVISCIVTWIIFYSMSSYSPYKEFDNFVRRYKKKYESKQKYMEKMKIYKDNLEKINEFNAGEHSYKLEANEFADLTDEEFYELKYLKPFKPFDVKPEEVPPFKVLKAVDWSNASVRDEGDCESYWVSATISMLETYYALAHSNTLNTMEPSEVWEQLKRKRLSYQELLDCATTDKVGYTCNAGDPCTAFDYIKQHGISSLRDYPSYVNNRQCFNNITKRVLQFKHGCKTIQPNLSLPLAYKLQSHPVIVYITSSSFGFRFYKSGIITERCEGSLGHYALLVGEGVSDKGLLYWKVKNTWGPNWGDKGYVKILRVNNENPSPSVCDITASACYPA